jgi:hypothetical protein
MDRATQRETLRILAEHYPVRVAKNRELAYLNVDRIDALLGYLEQHKLIECTWFASLEKPSVQTARITAAGLDFIADDGGLSAVLGVQTIRIHEDSIKALALQAIEASPEPEQKKGILREALEKAPQEVIKTLASEAVKAGLKHAPDAMPMILRVLGVGT